MSRIEIVLGMDNRELRDRVACVLQDAGYPTTLLESADALQHFPLYSQYVLLQTDDAAKLVQVVYELYRTTGQYGFSPGITVLTSMEVTKHHQFLTWWLIDGYAALDILVHTNTFKPEELLPFFSRLRPNVSLTHKPAQNKAKTISATEKTVVLAMEDKRLRKQLKHTSMRLGYQTIEFKGAFECRDILLRLPSPGFLVIETQDDVASLVQNIYELYRNGSDWGQMLPIVGILSRKVAEQHPTILDLRIDNRPALLSLWFREELTKQNVLSLIEHVFTDKSA